MSRGRKASQDVLLFLQELQGTASNVKKQEIITNLRLQAQHSALYLYNAALCKRWRGAF